MSPLTSTSRPGKPPRRPGRIVFWVSLAFTLVVGAATASHLSQLWRAMREDAENDRSTYARVLAKELGRDLTLVRAQMDGLEGKVLAALGAGDVAAAENLLSQETRANVLLREFAVVEPGGKVLASSNPSHTGMRVLGLDFLSAPRDSRLRVGRPVAGRSLSPRAGAAQGPEQARDGFLTVSRLAGTGPDASFLVAVVGTDSLVNEMQRIAGEPETFSVLRYDGELLATNSDAGLEPRDESPIFKEFLPDRETGAFTDRSADGSSWLVHFTSADEFPVLVETRIPVATVVSRWRAELTFPIVLLLLTVGAAWIYGRLLARTLDRLDAAAGHAQAQERRLRNILDSAADGIVTIDRRGVIVAYNQAAENIFRMSPAEAVGRPLTDLLPPELAGHQAYLERYFRTGKAGIIGHGRTLQTHRRDGTPMVVHLAVSEVVEDGESYFTGIVRDVTGIQEAEARFRNLFQRSGEPLLLFGSAGLVDCNEAALHLLGAKGIAELRGKRVEDLAAPEARAGTPSPADAIRGIEAIARREGVARLEWTVLALDGRPVPVEMTVTPIRLADGDALLVSWHDVSEQKRYEQGLREARDAAESATLAKSSFLAMMSHELRTPMAGMIGMVELLAESPMSPEQRRFVIALDASAKSLLRVLNDVLDYSKIEAGRMEMEAVPLDPGGIVGEVLDVFANAASRKGNQIRVAGADGAVPRVMGDPTRLRQVLLNLVGNAVKFTERGTITVRLDTRPAGDGGRLRLRFEVEDSGVGIPADVLPTLFHPFQQADSSTTRRFGGTGLGLAISRRLVEGMDGEIGVESEPGRGSAFWFEVPVERADATAAATAPESAPQGAQAPESPPLRILVAEDNPVNRLLISTRLRRGGHSVSLVENGLQAVEAVSDGDFDLVLMDMQMPELDGAGATRRIRKLPGSRGKVPVVALTADALPEFRDHYMQAGLDDYLTKPVDWAALDGVLARFSPAARASSP